MYARALRRFHFEHHDSDDDGENSVAEGLKAVLIHASRKCIATLDWIERAHSTEFRIAIIVTRGEPSGVLAHVFAFSLCELNIPASDRDMDLFTHILLLGSLCVSAAVMARVLWVLHT